MQHEVSAKYFHKEGAGTWIDGNAVLEGTKVKFLPSPEGVSKGLGRVELSWLPGEETFLIGPQVPEVSLYLAAVWILLLVVTHPSSRLASLPSGDAGVDLAVGKCAIWGYIISRNGHRDIKSSFGMTLPQPEPEIKSSKLIRFRH